MLKKEHWLTQKAIKENISLQGKKKLIEQKDKFPSFKL